MRMLIAAGIALALLPVGGATASTPLETALHPYAITYRPGPAWRAGQPMASQGLGPHAAYIQTLEAGGRIYAAGRVGEERGLAIIRAADLTEAQAILAADPAVTAGIFIGEVELFAPRFGGTDPIPLARRAPVQPSASTGARP